MVADSLTETFVIERLLAANGVRKERLVLIGPDADGVAASLRRAGHTVATDLSSVQERTAAAAVFLHAFRRGSPDLAAAQRALRPGAVVLGVERGGAYRRAQEALMHYFDAEPAARAAGARVWQGRARRLDVMAGHFDAIAPHYAAQIPTHLREYYLRRKLEAFDTLLGPGWVNGLSLDVGAGLGWYANALAERHGARIIATDPSTVPLRRGRAEKPDGAWPAFIAGDSLGLPFKDASFDFVYAINMVHHLKRGEQERALWEVHRVLKPDAPFLLFEINTRNPLFRWYMRQVFPRTRSIDRGDEEFVHPARLPLISGFELQRIEYATFAPDFLPRWSLGGVRALERLLEASPIRSQSIHYAALLRRLPARH